MARTRKQRKFHGVTLCPHRLLVTAVIKMAIDDLKSRTRRAEARVWWWSKKAEVWCSMVDIEVVAAREALVERKLLPKPKETVCA